MNPSPSYRARFVHLTVVWAFAVSQPFLAVIDGNDELLLAHELSRLQIVVFGVVVAFVPPALATGYVWLASRLSAWVGDMLYLAVLAMFLIPLAARAVKLAEPGLLVAIVAVLAITVLAVLVYTRFHVARLFVGYAVVLPLVGFAVFVYGLPSFAENAEAAHVRLDSREPVVLLLLDEFPVSSLMTRDGEIDAVRYPNFGRLARDATWYPNATTVHEWTSDAVPAILTGKIVRASTLPTHENYPDNLFTLLAGTYSITAHETWTRLCPRAFCERRTESPLDSGYDLFLQGSELFISRVVPRSIAERMIPVSNGVYLHDEATVSIAQFEAVLGKMSSAEGQGTLFYSHLLLPHAPWSYLPSGTQYDFEGIDAWLPTEHWENQPWPVLQGYQRHLLQLGYADRLLGRLLRRLERQGMYDDALLVVMADHGVSFRAGQGRRPLTNDNLADITNVPLFVKVPGQSAGRVDLRPARTIDVLPTVADVLGVRVPWATDGSSLLGPSPHRTELVMRLRGGSYRRASLDEMRRDRERTLTVKIRAFGEGRDSLYRIGTNRSLLGRAAGRAESSISVAVRVERADELASVRRGSGFVPSRIYGVVTRGRVDPREELAIAVNGRIRALTRCFVKGGRLYFRALVPETALRDGRNDVEVFLVQTTSRGLSLVLLGGTRTPTVASG